MYCVEIGCDGEKGLDQHRPLKVSMAQSLYVLCNFSWCHPQSHPYHLHTHIVQSVKKNISKNEMNNF